MSAKSYTVSQVARIARITVRTLHHYDEIGLLVPSSRSASGYRLYSAADLQRLHQVLLLRQLGFPLEAIQQMLQDPAFDRKTALRAQRELLAGQIRNTEALIRAVDAQLEALEGGTEMDLEQMFDGSDPSQYEDEARQRWGNTDAYQVSMRRTKRYTKEDWSKIKSEGDALMSALAQMLEAGRRPDEDEVADLAEQHRQHIGRWFYPCTHGAHAALAEMYVADPRFKATFEKYRAGLAEFVAEAIRANAARVG
jgi:DNA-binding transcriptional MerR regulator